jgi:hypothetical protein
LKYSFFYSFTFDVDGAFFGSTSVKLLLGQHNIWLNADVDDTSSDVDDTASSSMSMIQLSALGVDDADSGFMKMTQLSVGDRQHSFCALNRRHSFRRLPALCL